MAWHAVRLDQFLAAALGRDLTVWPGGWDDEASKDALVDRANYHGITGLLVERKQHLGGWPADVTARMRDRARERAKWELRHKVVVANLLAALADQGILTIVLKGTAFAYDLYATPAARERGDTDLLVGRADLAATRLVLQQSGFRRDPGFKALSDQLHLQEVWNFATDDGMSDIVDLHWQAMNSLALEAALTFSDCIQDPIKLPRLCEAARGMDRKTALLHACMHRAAHISSPYIVNGVAYYGGDRLIWACDIDLLANRLDADEWRGLCAMAQGREVDAVLLDGLKFAQARLGTAVPDDVMAILAAASAETKASSWLLGSSQARRALADLKAVRGLRSKFDYLMMRALPSGNFMREKYPDLAGRPLATLYLRRLTELLRRRPERSDR